MKYSRIDKTQIYFFIFDVCLWTVFWRLTLVTSQSRASSLEKGTSDTTAKKYTASWSCRRSLLILRSRKHKKGVDRFLYNVLWIWYHYWWDGFVYITFVNFRSTNFVFIIGLFLLRLEIIIDPRTYSFIIHIVT